MKRLFSIILAAALIFSLCACAKQSADDTKTLAQTLSQSFTDIVSEDGSLSALEIAQKLSENEALTFDPIATNIAPGFLSGFDNFEVTGFSDGALFGPMIGSIPFIGYVFTLDADTDTDEFVKSLEDNANLRWNICVAADEMISATSGDKVFFVMAPTSAEQD